MTLNCIVIQFSTKNIINPITWNILSKRNHERSFFWRLERNSFVCSQLKLLNHEISKRDATGIKYPITWRVLSKHKIDNERSLFWRLQRNSFVGSEFKLCLKGYRKTQLCIEIHEIIFWMKFRKQKSAKIVKRLI